MSENTTNHARNLLVIKASAGSGKTYKLAQQYLKHLLFTTARDGKTLLPRRHVGDERLLNSHRQLLAITFTNKATDEMKRRIVNELYNLSKPGAESDYLDEFMKESGLDEAAVRKLAHQALEELLFDYSNFNVSTIDSFFQSILRNFARELDRDFNYDIQLEEKYAVGVAVHNFMLSLGNEEKPTPADKWVKEYQRHLLHDDPDKREWRFFKDNGDLRDFANQINTEVFRGRMNKIRAYLTKTDRDGQLQNDFSRIYAFMKYVRDMATALADDMAQADEQLLRIVEPLAGGLKKNSALIGVVKNRGFKTDALMGADEDKVASQFYKDNVPDSGTVSRIQQLITTHFDAQPVLTLLKHVGNHLGMLGMLGMIDAFLEEYRHESNSILIGDTNELIGTVLDSGSEFVYERVGSMIAHFMIDEFQDTSTKQYENFCSLLRESLASGNFNMLIGDAKQSIYRFRNADPTVFREKVEDDFKLDITDGLTPETRPGADEPKSTNYRSSEKIIEFNNNLFEYVLQRYSGDEAVKSTYKDYLQAMPPNIGKKLPGYVRLFTNHYERLAADAFIHETLEREGVLRQAGGDDGDEGKDKDKKDELNTLMLLPAYLMQLHQRYDWGQIGILGNTRNDCNNVVQRILEYNQRTTGGQINIISGESLLLKNSPVIRRIIAMLRFIDISEYHRSEDDADDTELNEVAERVMRKRRSEQHLYVGLNRFIEDISAHPGGSPLENGARLTASLNAVAPTRQADEVSEMFAQTLAELLPGAGELTTLVSIVESIIAHFKHDEETSADVDRETAFLLAFQDAVMRFSTQRNGGSVREFLKYWDENKDKMAVSSADSGDAINIMTIHKAKGLEFDCVLLPFANWQIDDNYKETDYWMPDDVFIDVLKSISPDGGICDETIVPPMVHVDKKSLIALLDARRLGGDAGEFIAKRRADVIIDNLNKTYVAMTRPRTELHVFCGTKADNKHHNDMLPLMSDFAAKTSIMVPMGRMPDGSATGWYEYGSISSRDEIQARQERDQSDVERIPVTRYMVSNISGKLRVRVEHASSSHIKAGKRLHGLLSLIHDRDDVERVITQGIKHGVITDDPEDPCGKASVEAHVRRPVMEQGGRVAAWFDPANKVYSERTITTASDNLWDEDGIENLRPDRIIMRPDGSMLVIDYKSGQRDDKRYCRQVQRYIDKLRLIFPDAPIAGRIWYVTLDVIIDEQGREFPIH